MERSMESNSKGAYGEFKNNLIPGTPRENLMADLRTVAADAEELLRATTSQAGEEVAAARARIQESLKVIKERVMAGEKILIERGKQAAKITDQYVHESPWKAVGISAGVGLLVGILIARR